MKFKDSKAKLNSNSESKCRFLIKFLVISTLLFLVYLRIAEFLFSTTLVFANLIMSILGYGYELSLESGADLSDVFINLNILAYIALILATPKMEGVTTNKRIYFLIPGSIFLFIINASFIASDTIISNATAEPFIPALCVMFFGTFGQVFFPFVLWFALAHEWLFGNL